MADNTNHIAACVRSYLEDELGFPLDSFPSSGIEVRESPKRQDRTDDRMLIVRIGQAALAIGIPRVVGAIIPVIHKLDIWEVFSPFGVAELDRALKGEGIQAKGGGFHYTLARERYCRSQALTETPAKLLDEDVSPTEEAFDRDWFDAFGIEKDDQRVAVAQIRWKMPKFIEVAVETQEPYRQLGGS